MIKFTIEQLLGNAVYIGNRKMYRSNEMNRFLVGYRSDLCLINLSKTVYMLKRALRMFELVVSKRGYIIFGGVDLQGPFDVDYPGEFYTKPMWYGGSLTNMRRVYHLVYGATPSGKRFPSVLVLLNDTLNKYFILNEAICQVLPSIALIDSDMHPEAVVYAIPSCNKITGVIDFYIGLFGKVLTLGCFKGVNFLLKKRGLKRKNRYKNIISKNKNIKVQQKIKNLMHYEKKS